MARAREHGTPEGYEAGCTKNAACPAYRVHGMSCETAYLRFISGERRYMQLRGRGLTSTAIATRLGFRPPIVEQLPPEAPTAAPPLAESAQDTAPQEDAGIPAVEEEAPAAGTPVAEAEAMGHPTHSTPKDTTTMVEISTQHETLPRSAAPTLVPEDSIAADDVVSPDEPVTALAEELAVPAVPKMPRQKPVTKPKVKARRSRVVGKPAAGPSQSEVRAWARHVGLDVNAKGSVRSDVMKAYLDAHPTPAGASIAGPTTTATAPAGPETSDDATEWEMAAAQVDDEEQLTEEDLDAAAREIRAEIDAEIAEKGAACRVCGCTDWDCTQCIERTGAPCSWVTSDLCSACVPIPPLSPTEYVDAMAAAHGRAQVPTVEEFIAAIYAEQDRAATEHGYTDAHDDEYGIRHLLNWAIDYARRDEKVKSGGLILKALKYLDRHDPETSAADDFRPEWADVTIPEDIRRARRTAARLEEDNARLQAAVDVAIARWWAQVEENTQLRIALTAERSANAVVLEHAHQLVRVKLRQASEYRRRIRGGRR